MSEALQATLRPQDALLLLLQHCLSDFFVEEAILLAERRALSFFQVYNSNDPIPNCTQLNIRVKHVCIYIYMYV